MDSPIRRRAAALNELTGSPLTELLQERIVARRARAAQRAVPVWGYMENIGYPELFGYDMNRYLDDAAFALAQSLRERIFWCDTVADDFVPDCRVTADVGMYFDMTFFGQRIIHDANGVPRFHCDLLQNAADWEKWQDFDFHRSGIMPRLIEKYERMCEIAQNDYAGAVTVEFPHFHRGVLDIYLQCRGYENFLFDTMEEPEQLRRALRRIAEIRVEYARRRARYLGQPLPETTFIADDWVNLPFISPEIFQDFVAGEYEYLQTHEAPVTGFHTCGRLGEIAALLPRLFPRLERFDVSPWNDLNALDALVPRALQFTLNIKNTITLSADIEPLRALCRTVGELSRRRRFGWICLQAVVRLCPSWEETFERVNRTVEETRKIDFFSE